MKLYDYVDQRGTNIIRQWTGGLQLKDRAKLHNKLKMLELVTDPQQLPRLMAGPGIQGEKEIWKLQIGKGGSETALRPMACRGPFDKNREVTLLIGCQEKDRKLPKGIAKAAESNRQRILANPAKRWREHEWVGSGNERTE